jgi:MFS family permease
MVGLSETYFLALYLAIGFSSFEISLLATLPIFAGSLLQLVTPQGIAWLGSLRRWVVLNATLQAISLMLLAGLVVSGIENLWCFFVVIAIYNATGQATSPGWNAWIERLVPKLIRNRFLSRRLRLSQICLLLAVAGAGFVFQWSRHQPSPLLPFVLLLGIASLLRGLSAWSLSRQFELKSWANLSRMPQLKSTVASPSEDRTTRLICFFIAMQFAVFISASFFTPFKLKMLGLNYVQFSILVMVGYLGKIAALDFVGRLAKRIGGERLLLIGSMGILPIAGLWAVTQQFWYLMAVQMLSGIVWAFFELATILVFIERIPAEKRLRMISRFNVGNSAAMVGGAMLGAFLLGWFKESYYAYLFVFVASTACRTLAITLFPFPLSSLLHPNLRPRALRLFAFGNTFETVGRTIFRPLLTEEDDIAETSLDTHSIKMLKAKPDEQPLVQYEKAAS